jgi:hypothetical protein
VSKLTLNFFTSNDEPKENKALGSKMEHDKARNFAILLTAITDAGMVSHLRVDHSWKGYHI